MFGVLVLLFLVVPIAELAIFLKVAAEFGLGVTLLWIVAVSIAGGWLVKQQGISTWRRAQQRLAAGEMPADELLTGVLILFGGALMMTPGFLTDALGLVLLFPPTRAVVRAIVRRRIAARTVVIGPTGTVFGSWGGPRRTGDEVWDVEGWEDPPERPQLR